MKGNEDVLSTSSTPTWNYSTEVIFQKAFKIVCQLIPLLF